MKKWIALIIILSACQKNSKEENSEEPIPVKVYQVKTQTIPVDAFFIGVAQSSHQVQIRPAVEGSLKHVAFQEGSYVEEGDLLFELDDRKFDAQVQEAEANLEKENAALTQATDTLNRLKLLFEQSRP